MLNHKKFFWDELVLNELKKTKRTDHNGIIRRKRNICIGISYRIQIDLIYDNEPSQWSNI